ncbi:MAG TPA: DUF1080 domain-containing protein [Armatimonadaceae bacterium]|nr:DUF1080 domain-containing protein [Armatimonadaceae bacterium]
MSSENPQQNVGYSDTPVLPGGKWRVHDGARPQPRVVTPGAESSPAAAGTAPSDAVVLFDGGDLARWKGRGDQAAEWKVENGYVEVVGGKGDITSRDEFGDAQIHVEFMSPAEVKGNGQGRGNSGVFIMNRYEIQVLDCYENPTYADGTVGSVYGQYSPLVNAARKPGEWQTYDIFWTAPRFKADGSVEKPAYVTVVLNGVLVQNHTELMGGTSHRTLPEYKQHGPKGPIRLQDHGNPVRFRNIWVRPLKGHDEA